MVDLEQLERLVRLRDAGGLTEAEFEAEKLKLLTVKQAEAVSSARPGAWIVGGVLVIVLLGAAYLWNGNRRAGSPETVALEAKAGIASTTSDGTAALGPTAGNGKLITPAVSQDQSALDFATSMEVIGLNPAYVEKRLGVPREKGETYLVFEVGGCRISYDIEKGRIRVFRVDIGNACRPKIDGVQVGPGATFGNILGRETGGELTADCLWGCGNAADPTIALVYGGSRANQWIAVDYSTDYEQASNPLSAWEEDVRKRLGISYENDFDVAYEVNHCVRNPPASLRPSLLRLKVRSVRVYFDESTGIGNC